MVAQKSHPHRKLLPLAYIRWPFTTVSISLSSAHRMVQVRSRVPPAGVSFVCPILQHTPTFAHASLADARYTGLISIARCVIGVAHDILPYCIKAVIHMLDWFRGGKIARRGRNPLSDRFLFVRVSSGTESGRPYRLSSAYRGNRPVGRYFCPRPMEIAGIWFWSQVPPFPCQ